MKYVIYTRISEENKIKNEDGTSQELGLQKQLEGCVRYCKSSNYVHFLDKDMSAKPKIEKRKVLLQAIEACEKGDILVAFEPDRLARSKERAVIKYLLRQRQAKLEYADGTKVDTGDLKSMLEESMLDILAEAEGIKISERTRDALKIKKANGFRYGTIPYGHRLALDGKRLEMCPIENDNLEMMLELQANGFSTREIAGRLDRLGIKNRKGKSFQHFSIWKILKRVSPKPEVKPQMAA